MTTKTMAEEQVIKFSKDDQGSLQHLSDLLHLFNHRNINQHRRSVWWRHFAVFRRHLNSIVEDVRKLNEVPTSHLERARKKAKDTETQMKLSQRLDLWQDLLVPKWQNAFSQVVADQRWAVLGVVLTAVLAQTCHIVGITTAYEDMGRFVVEKVLHEFGKEHWKDEEKMQAAFNGNEDDAGEVVARDELVSIPSEVKARTVDSSVRTQEWLSDPFAGPKPRPAKRKKGNAIDDLFSGLE